jgi:hypothetical protein
MASVQLDYSVTTVPFPLPAGASGAEIRVTASNPSPDPDNHKVALQGVAIFVPIGDGAEDIAADATGIEPMLPSSDWKLQPGTSAGVFAFIPAAAGSSIEVGADSVVFRIQNVQVNDVPGLASGATDPTGFRVQEATGDCKPATCPYAPLSLTKFPADWGTVTFSVDDPVIDSGTSTNLRWDTQPRGSGATYTIEYAAGGTVVNVPGQGQPALPDHGTLQVTPQATTTYTLDVTLTVGDHTYTAQDQKTVTVIQQPKITCFQGTLETAPRGGYQVRCDWTTVNADYCTLGGADRDKNPGSPVTVPIDAPGQFTLELCAKTFDGPQVDTSTLVVEWEATLTDLSQPWSPVLSDDGSVLYVLSRDSVGWVYVVALDVPPAPNNVLTQSFTLRWPLGGALALAPGVGAWVAGGGSPTSITQLMLPPHGTAGWQAELSVPGPGCPTTSPPRPTARRSICCRSWGERP